MSLDRADKLRSVETYGENNCPETLSGRKVLDNLGSDISGKLKVRTKPIDKNFHLALARRFSAAAFPRRCRGYGSCETIAFHSHVEV